jgi:hypothetical protein
MLKANPKKGFY